MSYLAWKAWHIIFVITWFSGLFYLPRLFVYHSISKDGISDERFKVMERKLYYGIIWPSGILATACGLVLAHHLGHVPLWLRLKMGLVALLWIFHLLCGHYVKAFKNNRNPHGHLFYRIWNELPVLILVSSVMLAVLQPSL